MHTYSAEKIFYKKFCKKIANILTPQVHDYKKWERKNYWLRKTGIKIGKNAAIAEGFSCLTGLEHNLVIEEYAALHCNLHLWNFNSIRIGAFCMFAADVSLSNGSHDKNTLIPYSGHLDIGKGVWVGNGAKIVGSLTIGNNAIIGAGALVNRDIPENAIAVGIPAKIIGYRELPEKVWHLGDIFFSPQTFQILE